MRPRRDVASVTTMGSMFRDANAFNGDRAFRKHNGKPSDLY